MPPSSFLRMSPSVIGPTTRPLASWANNMPRLLRLSRRNASSIVSVSAMVRRVRSTNFRVQNGRLAWVEGYVAALGKHQASRRPLNTAALSGTQVAHLPGVSGHGEHFERKSRIQPHETGEPPEEGSGGFQPMARNLFGGATSGQPSRSHVAF